MRKTHLQPIVLNPNVPTQVVKTRQDIIREGSEALKNGTKTLQELGESLGLNDRQILFVVQYLESDRNDKVGAAAQAYGISLASPKDQVRARAIANANLKHRDILALLNMQLDYTGFNQTQADIELQKVMSQDADYSAKTKGLDLFYKVTGREKLNEETQNKPSFDWTQLGDEELDTLIRLVDNCRIIQYIDPTNFKHPPLATNEL